MDSSILTFRLPDAPNCSEYLRNYTGGILGSDDDPALLNNTHNHGVSIVGWGYDPDRDTQHWIIRNSWGHYWGEMGYFRIELGRNLLGVEDNLAWATPQTWTTNGDDCYDTYIDPSFDVAAIMRRYTMREIEQMNAGARRH